MAEVYVVVVEHNLVCAIERTQPPRGPIPASPLEVSSQLAANNRANGCLDGRYYFTDTQAARTFASLCLQFVRNLAERRQATVDALPVGKAEYLADDGRYPDGAAPGAG
jgi:hypothetical protein